MVAGLTPVAVAPSSARTLVSALVVEIWMLLVGLLPRRAA
jgi:hypothetical protein